MSFYFIHGTNNLILKSTLFQSLPVRHAFGTRLTRPPGNLSPDAVGEDPDRPPWIEEDGLAARPVWLKQVHSSRVIRVWREDGRVKAVEAGNDTGVSVEPLVGDALVTAEAGLWLSVQTADCIPVLLFDPEAGVAAAIHSGWRGTIGGISGVAAAIMAQRCGARVSRIRAAVGPGIQSCCYRVSPDLAESFESRFPGSSQAPSAAGENPLLNLAYCIRKTLLESGVLDGLIDVCPLCTHCSPTLFHSYRRDGEAAGRLYTGIMGAPSQDVLKL